MAIYDKIGTATRTAYKKSGTKLLQAYAADGSLVLSPEYEVSNYCTVSVSAMQGFAIKDGVIFQFRATGGGNLMDTIDVANQTTIATGISVKSDHGDSATFSDEFYATGDAFPLLYVTADTNPARIYINRVTTTSSTLVMTLTFPLAQAGYYAALCLNGDTVYMVGYTQNDYQTDGGGANKVLISKWDLTRLTANGDGTYTPAFLNSYERPFILCMQGQDCRDGILWIASGMSNTNGYIYALDPEDGSDLWAFPTNVATELEGVSWISDTELVYGLVGATYKKITFGGDD